MVRSVKLNSGSSLPILGMGTVALSESQQQVKDALLTAIQVQWVFFVSPLNPSSSLLFVVASLFFPFTWRVSQAATLYVAHELCNHAVLIVGFCCSSLLSEIHPSLDRTHPLII
jgi:Na+/phosphate symporter